jgi:hypothetical protein
MGGASVASPLTDPPIIGAARVNNFVSVDFTVFQELTVSRAKTVGRFYNPGFGRFPLTIVCGLRARINPLGMGIA